MAKKSAHHKLWSTEQGDRVGSLHVGRADIGGVINECAAAIVSSDCLERQWEACATADHS
jgi:hypothetical protein